MLGDSSLLSFYNAVTDLSNVWFANTDHSEITKQMEKFIFDGGVYGNIDNSAAVSASRGESKLKSFLHLMFLPRQNLEVIYPNLKNKSYLLPYYHIKRLCRVFNKDKRKKITSLTTARNCVSDDKVHTVGDMLKKLDLV